MERYPFGSGRPDPSSFPKRELAEAAMRILPEMGNELALYPGTLGYQPMRQVLADRLLRREGIAPSRRRNRIDQWLNAARDPDGADVYRSTRRRRRHGGILLFRHHWRV